MAKTPICSFTGVVWLPTPCHGMWRYFAEVIVLERDIISPLMSTLKIVIQK